MSYDDDSLPPLARIAKEAGKMVAEKRADIVSNHRYWLKNGAPDQPVSASDIMSDELIARELKKHYGKDIAILSEEDRSGLKKEALKARDRFEVDSLDNSGTYVENMEYDGYSVNIGRVKNGAPAAGAVYFPAKKELYFTSEDGRTAYVQHENESPKELRGAKGLPLNKPLKVAVGWHGQDTAPLDERGLEHVNETHPGQYRALMTATGQCDVTSVDKGFKTWDITATHAILKAAGAEIVGSDGQPKEYGAEENAGYTIAGGVDTLKALGMMDRSLKPQRELE